MFVKVVFLTIIILISVWGVYSFISPAALLTFFWFFAIAPIVFVIQRKNLLNSLLLWFVAVLFREGVILSLPVLPDIFPERLIWVSIIFIILTELAFRQRKLVLGNLEIESSMVIFSVYVVASMFVAGTLISEGKGGLKLSTFLSGYGMPFSIYFFGKNLIDDEQKIKKVFIFFTIVGFYLGLTGIFEYFKLTYLIFPRYILSGWVHAGRSMGPFLNASVNGTVIGMILFMTTYLVLHEQKRWLKIFYVLSITVMLITLVFTLTRACWLAFLIALFIFPVFYPRVRVVFVGCLLVLSILFAGVYKQLSSDLDWSERAEKMYNKDSFKDKFIERMTQVSPVYGRASLYGVVWRIFLDHPIFGVGYGKFMEVSPKYLYKMENVPKTIGVGKGTNVHDTWSGVLAELGIVGLGLILFIMLSMVKVSIKLYRLLPENGFMSGKLIAMFLGMFIIYLINAQLIEMHFFPFPNSMFYLFGGIASSLYQKQNV
ncbi:MAG: O-antigen ligase family protein [Nitrospirae bacterium]|nr:O-antigen ligase family protein [Nitrospirota bacterium]